MSEENKENLENEVTENEDIQETAAEVAEDVAEDTAEEAVEEVTEDAEEENEEYVASVEELEAADALTENSENEAAEDLGANIEGEAVEEVVAEEPKKSHTGLIIGIAAGVVVVAAVVIICVVFGKNLFNKYNRMGYIDVSGKTIAQIADESGYELADFLAEYQLPADMPGTTSESAAYYNIPCKKMAEMYGMDFAALKEMLKWGDDITEDTTWGVAEGETTVAAYVGEENIDSFKEQYGFGDEVTGETKWKEIRNTLDQKQRDDRIAAEKAQKEAEKATDAPETTEAPAEGDAAATEAPAETNAPAAE